MASNPHRGVPRSAPMEFIPGHISPFTVDRMGQNYDRMLDFPYQNDTHRALEMLDQQLMQRYHNANPHDPNILQPFVAPTSELEMQTLQGVPTQGMSAPHVGPPPLRTHAPAAGEKIMPTIRNLPSDSMAVPSRNGSPRQGNSNRAIPPEVQKLMKMFGG